MSFWSMGINDFSNLKTSKYMLLPFAFVILVCSLKLLSPPWCVVLQELRTPGLWVFPRSALIRHGCALPARAGGFPLPRGDRYDSSPDTAVTSDLVFNL